MKAEKKGSAKFGNRVFERSLSPLWGMQLHMWVSTNDHGMTPVIKINSEYAVYIPSAC